MPSPTRLSPPFPLSLALSCTHTRSLATVPVASASTTDYFRQFLDANLCWFLSMRRTFRFASVGRRRASHFSLDYYPPLQFGTAAMHIG
jgi:hypothetical protein